jgi:NAD(P)-dependent dehydrogenase (short-subunit alcohol dehydrogenase family)
VDAAGSSRSLGSVLARALAGEGAQLAVHAHRNPDRARLVLSEIEEAGGSGELFEADLANTAGVQHLADEVLRRFGKVDILINNVGPYSDVPFSRLPVETWDAVLNSNLRAPYLLAQRFAPGMREGNWGRIINISAVSALLRVHSIYGLSKAALIHLTECLALELAPAVTVNTIAPGQIEESEEIDLIDPTYKSRLREATPSGKLVTREEIADVVRLLCSGRLPSLTGQTLVLDGGWSLPVGRATPSVGTVV